MPMKKTIKINFENLWGGEGIDAWKNVFFPFLNKYYNFVLSDRPDFVVFSNTYGREMPIVKTNATKIFFMGEPVDVDMSKCDWAFGNNYIDHPNYIRFPYYVQRLLYTGIPFDDLIKKDINIDQIVKEKTKFCNFLFSNTKDGDIRNRFFKKLSKYKRVDSAGKSLNNMGYILPGRMYTVEGNRRTYPEKFNFLRQYKFTISYENNRGTRVKHQDAGYTSEKPVEPMLVNSIPIYRGNPRIGEEFNSKSFVNFHDFKSEEEMIEYIIKIDQDDELYRKMLREPWLHGNRPSKYLDLNLLIQNFRRIFG